MHLSLDLRHNLRLLRRNIGFVALCVLVIGLSMALVIVMFSFINVVAYNPLPYPDGDRYIAVKKVDRDTGQSREITHTIDVYVYQALQASVQSFKTFGATRTSRATFSDGVVSEQFIAANITPDLVQVTAIEPLLGRILLPEDDLPGAEPVVLISYRLWQNYYAGSEDVIGATSRIDGNLHTIIGVMPEGFLYPYYNELWLPLQLPSNLQPGDQQIVNVIGILSEGISLKSASAEVDSLLLQLGLRLPEFYSNHGAAALPYTMSTMGAMSVIYVYTAVTIILLLLVCLNVANLLVVRSNERMQELAIRNALGASPWRIIQSVLLDSLLICMLGSLVGIVLADAGLAFIRSFIDLAPAPSGPFWFTFGWDFENSVATLLIMGLIWLFPGGLAAWKVYRQDISIVLAGGSKGASGAKNNVGSAILVSFEIVFSCFLLILSGIFIGSNSDLSKTDYGTATEAYLTGRISLPASSYSDSAAQNLYQENLRRELLGQDGISKVTFVTALPSVRGVKSNYNLEDRNLLTENGYPSQEIIHVADNYFETMEVALRSGRFFDATDTFGSLPVVIIDEVFAAKMWPEQAIAEGAEPNHAALGKRLQLNPELTSSPWLTVVGVTAHIVQGPPETGIVPLVDEPSLYRPLSQNGAGSFSVVLKVEGEPDSYSQTLQRVATAVDREIPVTDIYALGELIKQAGLAFDFLGTMFSNISLITLVLAVTGIYAIVSRSVMQRAKEIGIRRALGSTNGSVLWVFVGQGFKYLLLGLVIGGGGAALVTNVMNSVLITGVLDWLPLVFISVSLGLGVLIFVAAFFPTRQLVSLEPGEALHYD